MTKFLNDFKEFTRANNLNVFRVAEINDGSADELEIFPTCACLDSYSVAKAFVVTAIGMLVDDGLLSTDEKIVDILADEIKAAPLPDYADMTVHHALRHSVGLPGGYLDIDCAHPSTYGTDFLTHLFTTPTEYKPGTRYVYTDAAFYMLARIAEKRSGLPLESMLWQRLFTPLGFREAAWSKCPEGHAMGATGLYIHTSDMAKLGELYLRGGEYNGTRVISQNWCDTVLARGYEFHGCGNGWYGKGGMYGQMLMFSPETRRVVAWHGFEKGNSHPLVEWVSNYKD